jgi:hypothetical protein
MRKNKDDKPINIHIYRDFFICYYFIKRCLEKISY